MIDLPSALSLSRRAYLERKPGANLIGKDLGNDTIEGREDPHGKLRLDPALIDQVIQRIRKGQSETKNAVSIHMSLLPMRLCEPAPTIELVVCRGAHYGW